MATKRVNITVDPEILGEFYLLTGKRGIKQVQGKMEEFIEEEKMIEDYRKNKRV